MSKDSPKQCTPSPSHFWKGVGGVAQREWRRMTSRRLYLGVCLVLPLFTLFFMATIFGNGQMEELPIGLVDQDNTATSRTIGRNIAAVPTFKVTKTYTDEAEARRDVQRKEIYGYLSIPPRFEQDALSGKQATLSYYYHYALLSVGGELMAAFETSLAPVALSPIALEAVALGAGEQQVETFLLPIQASNHPLYNPSLDYSVYLSQPFFFILFQVLILLITVYVVGSEIKFHTADDWLATAKGNILIAVLGKLLPYTLLFSLVGILANYVMFGILQIPFQGSWLLLNGMTLLFIIATQALGLFLFSLFPVMALVISVVSMVGSLGATLSGVTFPVRSMYPLVHDASYLFPVRHYTEITQTMLYSGGGFASFWPSAVVLCVFPLLALAMLGRLRENLTPDLSPSERGEGILPTMREDQEKPTSRQVVRKDDVSQSYPLPALQSDEWHSLNGVNVSQSYPSSPLLRRGVGGEAVAIRGKASVARHEFFLIATSYPILLVLLGGIFVYGLLYNYMYAPNIVTDAPIAVVDNSHSSLSRQYIRWLDATPGVAVYAQATNYHEAREWMKAGEVEGILYLPHSFEEDVSRGEGTTFSLYATTDAFLYFKTLQEATAQVMLALDDAIRPDEAVFLSPQGQLAVAMTQPILISGTALYNPTGGYGSYLIPAVMMIILFQTLLMVIGMLTGEERTNGTLRMYQQMGTSWKVAMRLVVSKSWVYCLLYAVFSFFLLGLLPYIFSIPHIGNGRDVVCLMIPYLLATSFLGLAASRYFTDAEAPVLMIAFFSVGLIFLSGVSYPLELMPWYWQAAHYVLPAAPATLAFVKINSMGASMADVGVEYLTLWIQVLVYFGLSVWVYKKKLTTPP